MKAMLITVGTGKTGDDIAQAIQHSINRENPDLVYFILTDKTQKETLPHILRNFNKKHEEKLLGNENDVEKICLKCISFIEELGDKHYLTPKDIVIDYTSGTKAMSAGLCLAGFLKEVSSLNYIAGERGEGGRVISGTERPYPVTPTELLAQEKLKKVIDYFNKYQFKACLDTVEELKKTIKKPNLVELFDFMEKLVKGYSDWDKFDFKEALELLREIKKSPFLEEFGIKDTFHHNCMLLNEHEKANDKLNKELIIDLWQNAKRRNQEGKYDDAMARLYRLLEFIAQYKLNAYKVDTDNFQADTIKDNLGDKYESWKDRKKIGLEQDYSLLRDLGEAIGLAFCNDESRKKILKRRNNSILAHGFIPIKKELSDAFDLVEKYILCVMPKDEFADLEKKASFPELKEIRRATCELQSTLK